MSVQASSAAGRVLDYWIHNFHDSFVFTVDGQANRPACASFGSPNGRYVVDPRTERGKAIIAAVISAKSTGVKVQVGGAGTCTYYGDSEDLQWFRVAD